MPITGNIHNVSYSEEIDIDDILSELEELRNTGAVITDVEELAAGGRYMRHYQPHPVHRPSWTGKIEAASRQNCNEELEQSEIQTFKCGR